MIAKLLRGLSKAQKEQQQQSNLMPNHITRKKNVTFDDCGQSAIPTPNDDEMQKSDKQP